MAQMRLNKFLAERLGISRREADDLIAAGKILVNGKVAQLGQRVELARPAKLGASLDDGVSKTDEGTGFLGKGAGSLGGAADLSGEVADLEEADPGQVSNTAPRNAANSSDKHKRDSSKRAQAIDNFDEVCYNGDIGALRLAKRAHVFQVSKSGKIIISPEVRHIYLAMNKPVGYLCSRKSQGEVPTIYELLPQKYQDLKTVGRLDKDSSGLILFTNDGDFAFQMTHPRFTKTKVYEVTLDKDLEPLHQQMIADFGIEIGDGLSKLGLAHLDDGRKHWRVTMSEGRNRQIRRTFAALGYTVTALHRVEFGKYQLAGLGAGEFVEIEDV